VDILGNQFNLELESEDWEDLEDYLAKDKENFELRGDTDGSEPKASYTR